MRLRMAAAAVTAVLLTGGGAAALAAAPAANAAVCTTSSPTGACGPYSDPTVYTSGNGADLVVQNDFSSISQTLNATDSTTWNVNANTGTGGDQTSVKSYPATQVTYTTTAGNPDPATGTGADFGTSLTSDFTNTIPSGSGQDFEYAVDDWLADPSKPSWTNDLEIMIWTYTNGQVPAGSDTGAVYTDAAGTQWEIWVAGGATTVSPDSTISFVRKANATSGSLDRWGFYNYLIAHSMLNSTFGIDQLNYGLEICGTGGSAKTYGVTGYDIVKNGTGGGGGGTAPVVTTGAASGVTSSGATLNGTVNPEGASATYQFEYGTTTAYGSVAPATPGSAGSGSSAVPESAAVSGLTASTLYHFRLDATNATGTTDGTDGTFTTSSGGGGGTAVAFDASGGAKNAGSSPLTWTQVVSGTNRALLAEFTVGSSNDNGCLPSLTDNGVNVTRIALARDNNQHAGFLAVYGLANPPAGTNTLVASVHGCTSAPSALTGGSESFTGVSQSAPFPLRPAAAGAGTQSSVTVTTGSSSDLAGEFVADGNMVSSAVAPVVSKFIENQNSNSGAGTSAGGYRTATGGADTGQWNFAANDWWGAVAVDIAHA